MKTNLFFSHHGLLAVTTACLLSASSLQAQTSVDQGKLTASTPHLEASVYPIINTPATIKVSFNNPSADRVQVNILDEKGRLVYSEYERTAAYRRRFDLSAMPTGKYTVELKNRNERFVQSFSIEPPVASYITMGNQSTKKTPEPSVDKKLIVSY